MTVTFKKYLSTKLNETVIDSIPIVGGDISKAYHVTTTANNYFVKLNTTPKALDMFKAEVFGLQTIAKTNTIKTPKVLAYDSFKNTAFLVLEFIVAKTPTSIDFKNFGNQLAKMHQHTTQCYGLTKDNFIGYLPQQNTLKNCWTTFYVEARLFPQLLLATQNGLLARTEYPTLINLKKRLKPLFKNIKPSLLHGDLWSGNYLIAKDGSPYLIDPAIYYGHNEVDIALSKLFGGFDNAFYKSYSSHFPTDANTVARINMYQLYYLLVHLNMFGPSYSNSVRSILKQYF